MTSIKEATELIELAKASVREELFDEKLKVSNDIKKKYSKLQGVFVTLTLHGELKGCIGYPLPIYPLYQAIIEAAKNAAFSDPRFSSLTKKEYEHTMFEISIMTVPNKVDVRADNYDKVIKIGRDGIIVSEGPISGLLLPQVFTEYKATPLKALQMTCEKAGLDDDAWKSTNVRVETFQAEVFKELPEGKVVKEKLE